MSEPVWSTETMGTELFFQDPAWRSWRLWGGFWAATAGILSLPEVQSAAVAVLPHVIPTPYLPVASAILGALWPVISKARDPRPVR
jgi:hypothetical protein